jgi:iron(III) transport system ATP-binding protein
MEQVEVHSLAKHYEDVIAVNDLSFDVEKGELVSLLGPSGCGKSTTLRCIAGLEHVTDGEVYLAGESVSSADEETHVPPSERNLGMVFQSFALWPNKTVLKNVTFGLKENPRVDMPKEERKERAEEYLELVDLQGYEQKNPRELSGGEQQRVALARALVYDPDVLLLDEPLSNLDAKLRKEARIWLKQIQEETGVTTLYVTHDQAEASALSDRMIILNQGQIEQVGTPEEVFKHPTNKFVADFLGKENFLSGTTKVCSDRMVVETDIGPALEIAKEDGVTGDQSVTIAISPEEISIVDETTAVNDTNILNGKVIEKLFYGDKTELVVEISDVELVVVVIERVEEEKGDDVHLRLPPEKCALLSESSSNPVTSIGTEPVPDPARNV